MLACMADWLCRWLPERGIYKNGKEAFLALVGYSVGLGNFWRFPYLSYRYKGFTFLIVHGVCMVCVGLPLAMMELTLGQYLGLGPTHLFTYMCPIFSGVGWGMVLQLLMIGVYYTVILSWSLFYLGSSFESPLPWSPYCNETECSEPSVNESYISAELYFKHNVLGQAKDGENPYDLYWWLVLCLAVAWVIVAVCLTKGIRHTGKVFYVTVIYPYVVLLCLFGLNSKNTEDIWLKNITFVDYEELQRPEIYSDAVSQVIYSLGVGHGVIMVASHNRLHHNVVRDTFLMCLLDLATSVFSTLVMFSLSESIPKEIIQDNTDITSLVFKVFSAVLAKEGNSLWSFLFFSMIFSLGFDSLLLMMECVTTTIFDQFPNLRPYHPIIIAFTCFVSFLLGLSMCMRNGMVVFDLLNDYTSKHSLLILTFLEIVIAVYIYGYRKVFKLMKEDLKVWVPLPVRWYLTVCWTVITPVSLAVVSGYVLYSETWTGDNGPTFIWGQVIAFTPLVLVPLFALYTICTWKNQNLKEMVSAKAEFYTARFREDDWVLAPANGIPMQNFGYTEDNENMT